MPHILVLPPGSKPPPCGWNRPHFWHRGGSLSLAFPQLLPPASELTAPLASHLHPHLSQELPKACWHPGPAPWHCVLFSVLSLKSKQAEPRVVFLSRSSDGEAHGEDPATVKSDWVHKIQGVTPQARKLLPPRAALLAQHGSAPAPLSQPGDHASRPSFRLRSREYCPSALLPPRGFPAVGSLGQCPTRNLTGAAPKFPS